MDDNLEEKYQRLSKDLTAMGSALLAFSGGVDSTLLLAVGKNALGDNIVAVTVASPLHPATSLEDAACLASHLKAEHVTIATDELTSESFCDNPPERCYLCKHERFSHLVDIAAREGIAEVIDGSQADDLGEYRPGMEAVQELGIRSPLLETGFGKDEVRALSRELGLETWNMPSSTCLATRVPYGQRITREKISIIERGESILRGMGLKQVRLRYVDDRTARIEVAPVMIQRLVEDGTREAVVEKMKQLGFIYVTVDLAGYRSGALNEVL